MASNTKCRDGHRFVVSDDRCPVPTERYTDGFLKHAASNQSQYDRTCRVLAAEVLRLRSGGGLHPRLDLAIHGDDTSTMCCTGCGQPMSEAHTWEKCTESLRGDVSNIICEKLALRDERDAAMKALVETKRDLVDDIHVANEARQLALRERDATLTRLGEIERAARERVENGHSDRCATQDEGRQYPHPLKRDRPFTPPACDCGHDELERVLTTSLKNTAP